IMTVTHFRNNEYRIGLQAPGLAHSFSYKKYQRTSEGEIEYKNMYDALDMGDEVASFFIGAEVTVIEGASAVLEKSPWNFASNEEIVCPLKIQPSGEFLVPLVTLADYFNVKPVLDKCVALAGSLSSVPNLDKLRIAFKNRLDEQAFASLSKDDARKVLASDLKNQLDGARWQKLLERFL
ncbi:hypothetical protein AAVH_43457, partial [Aphelenchoides avenae]